MQNTYQEKTQDLEVNNSGEKRKLEGELNSRSKAIFNQMATNLKL